LNWYDNIQTWSVLISVNSISKLINTFVQILNQIHQKKIESNYGHNMQKRNESTIKKSYAINISCGKINVCGRWREIHDSYFATFNIIYFSYVLFSIYIKTILSQLFNIKTDTTTKQFLTVPLPKNFSFLNQSKTTLVEGKKNP
jgi:hypothetical protein